jgi:hypothetical protein
VTPKELSEFNAMAAEVAADAGVDGKHRLSWIRHFKADMLPTYKIVVKFMGHNLAISSIKKAVLATNAEFKKEHGLEFWRNMV